MIMLVSLQGKNDLENQGTEQRFPPVHGTYTYIQRHDGYIAHRYRSVVNHHHKTWGWDQ
ncbi:hypothetical protein M404DRAFT_1007378 [Pisolithus tinctorius Marx 270]|uniref:Uncharacterized protein n=1 Tax=Pisolithus tinctorius Marx 270 TaxID=870435 RepID=A0A0C3NJM9_PISTI|nr:hypothetical protein M404DRAFT_1007378 [Pisolithus tinctorius Marx 270]